MCKFVCQKIRSCKFSDKSQVCSRCYLLCCAVLLLHHLIEPCLSKHGHFHHLPLCWSFCLVSLQWDFVFFGTVLYQWIRNNTGFRTILSWQDVKDTFCRLAIDKSFVFSLLCALVVRIFINKNFKFLPPSATEDDLELEERGRKGSGHEKPVSYPK